MNICVFGSSSEEIDNIFLSSAESLGKAIAENGDTMIFGAGKYGVMGAAARGAAMKNGKIIGVSPKFFIEMNVIYDNCTEIIYTETMRERKGIMEDKANAFIICAGGIGTFEEFFEVLTLKQLRRHSKPIIIYNVKNYYSPMLEMMKKATDERFMSKGCEKLYTIAETENEVFEQLKNYKAFSYDKYDFLNKRGDEQNG